MDAVAERIQAHPRARSRRRVVVALWVLAGLAAVVLAARLAAPYLIKAAVNRRLSQIPGYTGHVDSVNLNLWRGAYGLFGIRILNSSGQVATPFFSADSVDFSIAARELFRGRFVSQIIVTNGRINVVRGPSEAKSQMTADRRWQDVIHDLFPIDITYLEVSGGVLHFLDTTKEPKVDVWIHDLRIVATGLRNRPSERDGPLPAHVDVSGMVMGNGEFRLYSKLEPLADQPHFELNLELRKVSLAALNSFLEAYARVKVSSGQLELFTQVSMKDGHYEGYAKPFVKGVKFQDLSDRDNGLGEHLWKKVVSAASDLAKNDKTKQIATRIPFSGDVKSFDVHTWISVKNALHHGFVKALSQGFEGTPNPDDLPTPGPSAGANPAER